jgi:hypothetical protein
MIRDVRLEGSPRTTPWKFEAGTKAIVETIGFGAAVEPPRLGTRAHEMLRPLRPRRWGGFPDSLTIYGPTDVKVRGGRFPSTRSARTTSVRCSTKTASACAPATTVQSR